MSKCVGLEGRGATEPARKPWWEAALGSGGKASDSSGPQETWD